MNSAAPGARRRGRKHVMKNKLVYLASVALMSGGMAIAQSGQSSAPSTMDSQTGSSTSSATQSSTAPQASQPQTAPKSERPGAMGASTEQNGAAQGETPATGETSAQRGGVQGSSAQPATTQPGTPQGVNDPNGAPKSMSSDQNTAPVPKYAQPITSADSNSSSQTSSQQGNANSTASPNR